MSASPSDRSRPVDEARLISETLVAAVERHEVLSSTNERAKVLATQEAVELPCLVVADHQTAGRGRGANRWWTGPGSLAFSLLVGIDSEKVPQRQAPLSSLAAGIALVEALSPGLSLETVGLHWPNDVYVAERKLAGILVEMPLQNRLVVGVGVNTNCRLEDAPAELRDGVATVVDLTGRVQDHTSLLIDWLNGWENWMGRLPNRPEEIARRADSLCLQRGRTLRVLLGDELCRGRCLGIASDGALRIETTTGERKFYSGTVR